MAVATEAVYVPPGGLTGKLRRLRARLGARHRLAIRLDTPLVSITFDDFPRSAATRGRDALERRGWRGTFYASACYAGQTTHLGEMYRSEDIADLARRGHEIGCHTHSHLDASGTALDEVIADVARNAQALAEMGCRQTLTTFAFPYGETRPEVKTALMRRFRVLRGVKAGINRNGADGALLRAVAIDGGETRIARAVAYARSLAMRPGWLILYGHDVRDDPSPWGCTPAQLERVLDAVAESGTEVLPVREALDRLGI
jgi:peptidoglycan/xylan/chitin deacetylase (PgdA/CDA1 family)